MSTHSPDSEDWDQLIASIKRGKCVVMLGHDAVTARFDRDSPPEPIRTAFTKFLRKRLEDEGIAAPESDEASVLAETAVMVGGRDMLHEWVQSFYARQDGYVDPIVKTLADIDVRVIVNTVPGLPLEATFPADQQPPKVAFYDRNGPEVKLIDDWHPGDERLIYHLNGSLRDPASLALTDGDLLDVLVSVVGGNPSLPENLVSTLSDVTGETTYLFLGFRLYLWQHRVLMRVLDEAMSNVRRKNKSYAFEIDEIYPGTRNFFTVGHKISLFGELSPHELVAELETRMSEKGDEPVPERAPFPNKVFICHASEDKLTAAQLAAQLKRNGLTPWLDKDEIYGGAQWDALIKETLGREVQYVVILQSKNFAEKRRGESYLNEEILTALERAKRFPTSRTFIVPLFIDDDRTLHHDLKQFQAIDYTSETGVADLVSVIKKDIQEEMLLR